MERAMYSSTEIDQMQEKERAEYLRSLAAEGRWLWRGRVVDADEIGDLEQAYTEEQLDLYLRDLE